MLTIDSIIVLLEDIVSIYGIPALFLSMIIQSFIPVALPSDAVIISASALGMNNISIIIFASLGSTIGGSVGFLLVRKKGKPFAEKFLSKKASTKIYNWFNKWGWSVLIFGRAIPVISSDAIAFAAGLTEIKFKTFVPLAFIGAVLRVIILLYLWELFLKFI